MHAFLLIWLVMGGTLGVTVTGLWGGYRLAGTDLGVRSFGYELMVVLATSALHAAIMYALMALARETPFNSNTATFSLNGLITVSIYRITHLSEMDWQEPLVISAAHLAVATFVVLGWQIEMMEA